MYIKLNKDDYVVKINIDNFSLGMGNLEVLLDKIISNKWNWFNFSITDKLWYNDNNDFVTCININHKNKFILLG